SEKAKSTPGKAKSTSEKAKPSPEAKPSQEKARPSWKPAESEKKGWQKTAGMLVIFAMFAGALLVGWMLMSPPSPMDPSVARKEVLALIEKGEFLDAYKRIKELEGEKRLASDELEDLHHRNLVAWVQQAERGLAEKGPKFGRKILNEMPGDYLANPKA